MKRFVVIFSVILLLAFAYLFVTRQISNSSLEKERQRWNRSLTVDTTYKFNKGPNDLLVQSVKNLRPGKALDVGMGQGRNSIFLAEAGWDVTGIDIADEAMAEANKRAAEKKLKITTVLTPMEKYDFGKDQWDLVVFVYEGCLGEDDVKKLHAALKPGGIFVFEFFHRDAGLQMQRPDFGCESNTIKETFEKVGGFTISRYEEQEGIADYSLKSYKLIKLVATKNR